MSFPPGPPLPMPGMPPGPPMMPPPYAVPPMGGMIPMTVGMMPAPMMAPVAMTMPAPMPMPQHQKMPMKNRNQNTYKKYEYYTQNSVEQQHPDIPKGPPVTVFVGNITDRAPDTLVRQILQRCGIVLNWKRVQGANGKLQAFGFCEYGDPESALRAMRLLHDYELGERKLVVKVDGKTKEKLDEYKATKMAKVPEGDATKEDTEKEESVKEEGEASDDALDEMTKQRDNAIMTSLQSLIYAHSAELSKPNEEKEISSPVHVVHQPEKTQNSEPHSPKPRIDYERLKKNELDEMDLEEDKKSLIHREIDKFRDTYKE